ncbi:calmodulin-like protein 6 isoform X2 [Trachypithecus francoisi]|uniref:calmodulin-like protein 6 isoform X2 n=1 Tax=Trachypithecus francoisi TaxID=54180 RepID=UPI00141ADC4F|nr:calmodulin-like protein 6 isoform X2 [Trachypithecus francoisi]
MESLVGWLDRLSWNLEVRGPTREPGQEGAEVEEGAKPCCHQHSPCSGARVEQPFLEAGSQMGSSSGGRQTERLSAEQIKEYKGVFEMFDEEGNGEVKTGELERLMSLLGINPTKSELASMAKDVDRDNKGFFNCDGFLALMGVYHEKAQNQESELRAAFRVFDKEGKGYIDWNTLKGAPQRGGGGADDEGG